MADKKYNLVIVESPAKAKTIEKYLGTDFKVMASMGHIMDLPPKDLGVDLNSFDLTIVPIPGKEDKIKEIVQAAKLADKVFLASDPDREGEAISFHLQESIKRKDAKRVLFNAITKPAILEAMKNPLDLNDQKYEAQKTRRILDRLVGYKISPILWDKLQRGLSAGRVQSVALRIIVEREAEIKNFVPEKWFQIVAKMHKSEMDFEAKYYGDGIDSKKELEDEVVVQKILEDIKDQDFIVKDVLRKEKKQNATPPFTTSRLQQEASHKLAFPSKKTMQVAQKLYEGVDIKGKGRTGLITYMRTDSVRSEPIAIEEVRKLISEKYGPEYLPEAAVVHVKKKGDAKVQDAHEAIRPTNLDLPPESVRDSLDYDEFRLYSLIWNKFVASQMNPAILDQTTISFMVNGHCFKSSGSVVRFPGFKAVFSDSADEKKDKKGEEEEKEQTPALPNVDMDEALKPVEPPKLLEKWTQPPPRFNEGSLVKELEEKGIGRPSTYAAIIANIIDKTYVKKEESRFIPTDLGISLCGMLVKNFPVQMDIGFTAKMEKQLDAIEDGEQDWKELLKEFWTNLAKTIEEVKVALPSIPREPRKVESTGIKCVKCETGTYVIKKGKDGEFLGCSNYPECKSTQKFKKSKKGEIQIVEPKRDYADFPCPTCGKRMVLIKGSSGKFYGCEDYPTCKTTRPVPLDVTCNVCNEGKFIEKTSKNGNKFYSCSRYPDCKNAIWDKPLANDPCPKCNAPFLVLKEKKDEKKKHKYKECPNCKETYELDKKK